MKKTVRLLLLLCTVYSISAKSSTPTIESDTTVVSNEKVVYKVVQDKTNLYLSISTTDNNTIMSMLRLGVTVFFDVKGKENKDVFIKYPLQPIKPNFNREEKPSESLQTLEEENKIKQNIAKLIEDDMPKEAEYNYFDAQQQFHIILNSLDVSLAYTYNEEKGLLEYLLKIPKNRISTNLKEDFAKLNIGIETGKMQDLKTKRDNSSRKSKSNMQGGGPPSGGRGGRGTQNNDEKPEDQNRQQAMETIDFWFMVSE